MEFSLRWLKAHLQNKDIEGLDSQLRASISSQDWRAVIGFCFDALAWYPGKNFDSPLTKAIENSYVQVKGGDGEHEHVQNVRRAAAYDAIALLEEAMRLGIDFEVSKVGFINALFSGEHILTDPVVDTLSLPQFRTHPHAIGLANRAWLRYSPKADLSRKGSNLTVPLIVLPCHFFHLFSTTQSDITYLNLSAILSLASADMVPDALWPDLLLFDDYRLRAWAMKNAPTLSHPVLASLAHTGNQEIRSWVLTNIRPLPTTAFNPLDIKGP